MPMRITAGLSRKQGLPGYGSVGASCQLEFEVDVGLLEHDLDGLHERIRSAYAACSQAVSDELTRQQLGSVETPVTRSGSSAHRTSPAEANGCDRQRATERQLAYIRQLASQVQEQGGQKWEAIARAWLDRHLTRLSSKQASDLIDSLKARKEAGNHVDPVLNGAGHTTTDQNHVEE